MQLMTNLKINTCPQTIFINPVSENKVEKVVKNLKRKCSSGFDDVRLHCKEMYTIYKETTS
jgi:hypothetical protein